MKKFDVAILGSGFASSLCAAILAKNGRSVVIIDRGKHPRFAIGESTTPAADFLLHHLADHYGLSELIPLTRYGSWHSHYPHVRCGCKRGFSYVWHGNGTEYLATSDHCNELMVTANASREVADTQWYRPDVDVFFLQVAKSYGVSVIEEATMDEIDADESGNHRLYCVVRGERQVIHCPFVIDGSGPQSRLMKKYGGADLTSHLFTNTSAIYGHFVGGQVTEEWLSNRNANIKDFPYPFDQAAVHHLFHDGWLWQIGFDGDLTSIGFVTNNAHHHANGQQQRVDGSSEYHSQDYVRQEWENRLDRYPVLRSLYGDCRCAEFPGRLFSLPRIQRLHEKAAGENWAALSFTIGFVDPLHSTGIAHTLSTVERICEILLSPDVKDQKEKLQTYSSNVVSEFLHIDQIISTCYSSLHDFELFSAATMVYFAAAIALERHRGLNLETGFLLARDKEFCFLVEKIHREARLLASRPSQPKRSEIANLIQEIQTSLKPYNNVGLFTPAVRNMILHTTAAK
ncbi:MAG: tryptophan 7-halogenase [Pirellula sp.]|jgi:FADH2 O2-dependent halogenase|nr:tryptophan 7-halogenase [Pirellula sp.]